MAAPPEGAVEVPVEEAGLELLVDEDDVVGGGFVVLVVDDARGTVVEEEGEEEDGPEELVAGFVTDPVDPCSWISR